MKALEETAEIAARGRALVWFQAPLSARISLGQVNTASRIAQRRISDPQQTATVFFGLRRCRRPWG
jgi:hypothetical protein